MSQIKFRYYNEKLLFVTHTLSEMAKEKNPFHFNGFWESEKLCEVMHPVRVSSYIVDDLCLGYGVIEEVKVEIYDTAKSKKPDKVETYKYIKKKGIEFSLGFGVPGASKAWSVHYLIKFNTKLGEQFIKDYLDAWENDRMSHRTRNILKSEEQKRIVAQDIYKLIEKYPSSNLKVSENRLIYSEIDIMATMFFFERQGVIAINKIDVDENKITKGIILKDRWYFRIDVLDKFFKLYKRDNKSISTNINNDKIILEAEIKKDFYIWKQGNKGKIWNMKKKTDGQFFVNGEHMFNLLKNLGKPLIEREEKNNIVTSLSKKLDISFNQAEDLFFNGEGKWGLKKDLIKIQ